MLPWPRNHTLYSSWDIDWFKGGNQTQLKLTIVNETLHRDFIFELVRSPTCFGVVQIRSCSDLELLRYAVVQIWSCSDMELHLGRDCLRMNPIRKDDREDTSSGLMLWPTSSCTCPTPGHVRRMKLYVLFLLSHLGLGHLLLTIKHS